VDQLIPELGLLLLAKEAGVSHESTLTKIHFIFMNIHHSHALTAAVSGISVAIIMLFKKLKARVQKRHHWIVFIPDRFLVVVISAILAEALSWQDDGLEVLGPVSAGSFEINFPFTHSNLPKIRDALPTAFLISVLGFFESVVAAKALGNKLEANISANRELVALGVANLTGGLASALPAFGGYGRSKLNASTGGMTPMSSFVLSIITIICIIWLLPFLYFIPVSPFSPALILSHANFL
jgi:MFS superfamily sulfate permease-like transporter